MEEIVYSKNIKKSTLKKMNIVIGENTQIEDGVVLGFNVCVLGKSVVKTGSKILHNSVVEDCEIEKDVEIYSSFLSGSKIKKGVKIGPFAHIRPNCYIGEFCKVGNYVELKNASLGNSTKVSHLTYVGDAEIGEHCNIGCGVIFCNYNGKEKNKTKVGDFVFIGSNVNVVAPVKIEDYSYIAAGTTVTKNVNKDEFVIGRVRQEVKQNFINPYKEKINIKK